MAMTRRPNRATGRTEQFATRVTPAFKEKVRDLTYRDRLKIVELLELALDAYEGESLSTVPAPPKSAPAPPSLDEHWRQTDDAERWAFAQSTVLPWVREIRTGQKN